MIDKLMSQIDLLEISCTSQDHKGTGPVIMLSAICINKSDNSDNWFRDRWIKFIKI